jgi:hypothetical protein
MEPASSRVARKHVFIPAPEGHLPGPVDAKFLRLTN